MRKASLVIALFFCIVLNVTSVAHSGRTDSSGGHRDNKNKSGLGGYHYHCGGNPPHLHSGGGCPYNSNTAQRDTPSTRPDSIQRDTPSTTSDSIQRDTPSTTSDSTFTKAEKKLTIVDPKSSMIEGESHSLSAQTNFIDTTEIIIWSSSNSKVATIDGNVVTAVSPGTTTISCTIDSDLVSSYTLTVKATPITGLTKIIGSTLEVGDQKIFTTQTTPKKSSTPLSWTSSKPSVAIVDSYGKVIALRTGETTITVNTPEGISTNFQIIVIAKTPKKVTITEKDINIALNEKHSLSAIVTPQDAIDTTIKWVSNNEAVATIDDEGKITPHSVGGSYITAKTSNNVSDTIYIKVYDIKPETILVALDQNILKNGQLDLNQELPIEVKVLPENANFKIINYDISNPEILRIEDDRIIPISKGTCQIVISTDNGGSETITIEISKKSAFKQWLEKLFI